MTKSKMQTKEWPSTLLNWPPSRGPMPKWMSAPNRYDIPTVGIERIEGRVPPIKIVHTVKIEPELSETEKRRVNDAKRYEKKTGLRYFFRKIEDAKRDSSVSGSWGMSYHVETLASLTAEQAIMLIHGENSIPKGLYSPPARTFVIDINGNHYLGEGVTARVTIKPYRQWIHRIDKWSEPRQDIGYLLWQIAGVFKKLWKEHKKWNPWGHDVGDLYFERLSFKHNVLSVGIGS